MSLPRSRRVASPLTIALLTALFVALLANWPLWRILLNLPEVQGGRGLVFGVAFFGIVAALLNALLSLFAWRHVIKPMAMVMLVSGAICAHFTGSYGTPLDPLMMASVLATDTREAGDLMNWHFAAAIVLLGLLPSLAIARIRLNARPWFGQAWRNIASLLLSIALAAALLMAVFADMSATMRNHKTLRYMINPVNAWFSLAALAHDARTRPTGPVRVIGSDAKLAPRTGKPPLLMFMVGETARTDHFSLNGYARPTNPELAKAGVASYTDVVSCGTNTAESLPCMFSPLGREAFRASDGHSENLMDVLQRAGLAVLWVDNQSGCKGLCDRVPHANAWDAVPGAPGLDPKLCSGGECLDEALLHDLDQRLAALDPARRARGVVIVLHQMGSHGPAYSARSPADRKPFQPECTTNALQQCVHEELINAYDNSIAYTDRVLAKGIEWLGRQSADYRPLMLYVSDHGESLGENNVFLHGLPDSIAPMTQRRVPWIVWSTDPQRVACLSQRRATPLTHDNIFPSVLGEMGVQTGLYKPDLDMLAPCRR